VAFSELRNTRSILRVLYLLLAIAVFCTSFAIMNFSNNEKKQDEAALSEEIDSLLASIGDKISSDAALIESDQNQYESEWPDPEFSGSVSIQEAKYLDSLSITVKVSEENLDGFLAAEQSVNPSYGLKFPSSNSQKYLVLRNSDEFYADFVGADLSAFGTNVTLENSTLGTTLTRDDARESSPFTQGWPLEVRVRGNTLGADDVSYESWTSGQLNFTQILEDSSQNVEAGLYLTATTINRIRLSFQIPIVDETLFPMNEFLSNTALSRWILNSK